MKKLGSIKNGEKNIFPLITTRPRTMTFAEYQLLTSEQRQGEIVISDYPVPVEGDYVEVTADGEKTYATLLNELYAQIDLTKININSKIRYANDILIVDTIKSSELRFIFNRVYSEVQLIEEIVLSSSSSFLQIYNGSYQDKSTDIPSSGTKITLYYNSTKTLELGTLAQNCMMSDGATSVEDKLDALSRLIKKKSYTFSSFTENCMVTDLGTAYTVVIGIVPLNRMGWNLIARKGVSGSVSSNVWVITTPSGATLSDTFNIDVYYIDAI